MLCVLGVTRVYGFLWAEMERDRDDWKNADIPEGIRGKNKYVTHKQTEMLGEGLNRISYHKVRK